MCLRRRRLMRSVAFSALVCLLGCGESSTSEADLDAVTQDSEGDAVSDTPIDMTQATDAPDDVDSPGPDGLIESDTEQDDSFNETGSGLGIDYEAVASGIAPRYEPQSEDWTATGWPNDRLRGPDGYVDLSNFPNPGFDILADYLNYGSAHLDGFGLNGAVYVEFEGPIDPEGLPSVVDSHMDPLAAVQLVNVTQGSTRYGEQVALEFDFYKSGTDLYRFDNTLALRPVFGVVLAEGETYCAIITRKLTDTEGHHLSVAEAFSEVLFDEPTLSPLIEWLDDSPLHSVDVAMSTCFTTQRATEELRVVRSYLDSREVPEVAFVSEPLVFDEYHGTYLAPVFQSGEKPYADEGGGMVFGPDGQPVEQGLEEVRFLMMVPRDLPMPESGWPVMLYAHGTGGDYDSCRNVDDELLPLGYALLCIDQPLHGTRGPDPASPLDDGELVIYSFNFLNPGAGRTSFRQSAIDTMVLTRMVYAGRFDLSAEETFDGQGVTLDGEQIAFFGHSHGGLSGAIAAGIDPLLDAVLLSGAGAVLIHTLLLRKDPVDLSLLVQAALGVNPNYLNTFHPTMNLIQMMVDATDPVNYAPYWLNPDPGNTAKHVFITEGTLDVATPSITTETLAAAARIPLIHPLSNESEAHHVLGIEAVQTPLSLNVETPEGSRTAGLKQWEGGSHFVAFQRAEAEAMWVEFFRTYLSGSPTISTGEALLYGASLVDPSDDCADIDAISTEDLPLLFVGNTSVASDALHVSGCGGVGQSGQGQRDQVFAFEVSEAGIYRFVLSRPVPRGDKEPPTGPDHLYAFTDCSAPSESCLTVQDDDEMVLELSEGQTIYVAIDGSTTAHRGPYRLYVSQSCASQSCEGRECGAYGCADCGSCPSGERCDEDGQCIVVSTPGDLCEEAIEVGELPFMHIGSTLEAGGDYAFSDGACSGESTGRGAASADVSYRFIAPATERYIITLDTDFDGALYVVEDCEAIDESCLGAKRKTSITERLALDLNEGQAVTIIVDGAYNFSNQAGHYTLRLETCVPDCATRECGGDGCGGSCGSCDALSICESTSACVPFPFSCETEAQCTARPEGDVCESALLIDALPYAHSGSTTDHNLDANHSGCAGDGTPRGGASPDAFFSFVAPDTALYRFGLQSNFDSVLYVAESCSDLAGTCLGADQVSKKGGEELFLSLEAGDEVTVVVDGASNINPQRGTYTLEVDTCTPNCVGKVCGTDGCGGSCGGCDSATVCEGGACVQKAGDICSDLRTLSDDLPSSHSEDTANFGPSTSISCLESSLTAASPDVHYRFKAPETGTYIFGLEASFEAVLAVAETCSEAVETCLGIDPSQVSVDLEEDQVVTLIVDGLDSAEGVDGALEGVTGDYTLSAMLVCVPDCEGKACGSDGCGGACGTCVVPQEMCEDDGSCLGPEDLDGNTCESATPLMFVDGLALVEGDTRDALNHYGLATGACGPYEAMGQGSPEQIFVLAPEETTRYIITLSPEGFDALLYVLSDCGAIQQGCVALSDTRGVEQVTVEVPAGQRYYVVVDGTLNGRGDGGAFSLEVVAD